MHVSVSERTGQVCRIESLASSIKEDRGRSRHNAQYSLDLQSLTMHGLLYCVNTHVCNGGSILNGCVTTSDLAASKAMPIAILQVANFKILQIFESKCVSTVLSVTHGVV